MEKNLNEIVRNIDAYYDEARKIKDKVRLSPNNNRYNLDAAEKLTYSIDLATIAIDLGIDDKELEYGLKIDRLYFMYEKKDCLANYYYEKHETDKAVSDLKEGIPSLEQAIQLINDIPNSFTPKFIDSYKSRLLRWKYFYKNACNRIYIFNARKELDSGNYIAALDNYKKHLANAEEVIAIAKKIEPMYERVSTGNYIGVMCNISQTMAQIILENERINGQILPSEAAMDLLNYGLEAYNLAKKAGEQNPEWDQYKDLVRVTFTNLKNFLLENKNAWVNIYIHFQDKTDLLKIMQSIDLKEFNKVKTEILGENQTFKLWKVGSFFILLFLLIFLVVFTFVLSKISVYYFLLSLVGIQALFVIISATILKSINQLSEKSFIGLIKFVLQNEFKFFYKKSKNESET